MTFQKAQDYLLSLSNIPRQEYMRDPKLCDVYTKRLQHLLDIVENPEKKIPQYIHVTGTSGKGSVCLLVQHILSTAGYRTGVTISPHPTYITERWQIDGKSMPQSAFIKIVEQIKTALEIYMQTCEYDIPSLFEITTAMTLLYFAQKKVDWAVMEVGCGGKHDSTNIIPHKDVAVITNVGLDHTDILGDTKEKIAAEKVGIITPNSTVFTMESQKNILKIIEQECEIQQVPLKKITKATHIRVHKNYTQSFLYKKKSYRLPVLGEHQVHNACLAIDIATHLGIDTHIIQQALQTIQLPIRMEIVSKTPLIILDSAHNEDKIISSVKSIVSHKKRTGSIHMLLGFSENKDIPALLSKLKKIHPSYITCTRNTINPFRKVVNPKQLGNMCEQICNKKHIASYIDPLHALTAAKKQLKKNDILLITGSVFLAGELRQYLTK